LTCILWSSLLLVFRPFVTFFVLSSNIFFIISSVIFINLYPSFRLRNPAVCLYETTNNTVLYSLICRFQDRERGRQWFRTER
jgi:hypothetical protein